LEYQAPDNGGEKHDDKNPEALVFFFHHFGVLVGVALGVGFALPVDTAFSATSFAVTSDTTASVALS
jgi:hypothetical protein